MSYDPAKLDHSEILLLLAKAVIEYFTRVTAGEEDPFPYPEALIRGFNQLNIACALQDLERAKRPRSIPEFVQTWGKLPLTAWSMYCFCAATASPVPIAYNASIHERALPLLNLSSLQIT